jgi:RNAse (barnase) inhibitor barstar
VSDQSVHRILELPSGIYRWPARLSVARLGSAAGDAGWRCVIVLGSGVETKAEFLAACSDAFEFPDYFGHNWDALDECLADLAPAPGYLVLLTGMRAFAERAPADWVLARAIFAAAAERWRAAGVPFVVLVRSTVDTEPLTPLDTL